MSDLRLFMPNELFEPAAYQHFEGTFDIVALTSGPDVYSFAKPVSWSADITNVGDALLVQGSVEGTARTSCSRCLADVDVALLGEIEGYFLISDESAAPEDMDDDEFDVLPEDRMLDMEPLIRAALLLELPLVPLCGEDCKGLCPKCGANLNEGPCSCPPEPEPDPLEGNPFAVLRGMGLGGEEEEGKR